MKYATNPYHIHQMDLPFTAVESDSLVSFHEALQHEVADLVQLELTVEQMMEQDALLAKEYLVEDAHHLWNDLKEGFLQWELTAGQFLLSAADPTRLEWRLGHWWGNDETQFH